MTRGFISNLKCVMAARSTSSAISTQISATLSPFDTAATIAETRPKLEAVSIDVMLISKAIAQLRSITEKAPGSVSSRVSARLMVS